jgi:putative NADPH-quinone reductase
MGKHVLVINGNPDPAPERLSCAIANAYTAAAAGAGHGVARLDVGALAFPVLRHGADFLTVPVEASIAAARSEINRADHLVIIYPLWLGGPPALLKAFMEQISRAGFALQAAPGGFPKGRLKGKSARVIVTMGMPALAYRLIYGAHGVKAFNRSILGIAGIKPIATSYFGGIGLERDCRAVVTAATTLGQGAL